MYRCPDCNGNMVTAVGGPWCETCKGTGMVHSRECRACAEKDKKIEELGEDEEIRKATLHDIVEAAIEETRAEKAKVEAAVDAEKCQPGKPGASLQRFSEAQAKQCAATGNHHAASQKRRKAVERLGE